MPETNPLSNPTEQPLSDRTKGGYGFYGKHDSSQIEVGNINAPLIYPGSGEVKEKSGIKRTIKTTGGV